LFLPFVRPLTFLVSLAVLGFGLWLGWDWWRGVNVLEADGVIRTYRGPLWELLLALALLGVSFLGRPIVLAFLKPGGESAASRAAETLRVAAPDGSDLHAESSGPPGAGVLVLTHGWGLDARAWAPLRARLEARFRVLAWDLPGLGRSAEPPDGTLTLDRFARALGAVIAASGAERVVLVGHSIGGMTTETLFRADPAAAAKVAGVVLVNTTHTNPLRTMLGAPLWLALQKPVIEPLLRLNVPLSPVLRLMNWQSYMSGGLHLAARLTAFGRNARREPVELMARLVAKNSPAVQAKGDLAMLHWSMTEHLPKIAVPVLVLAGSADIITKPEASDEIARAAPAAAAVRFEGAGHCGYLERTDDYAEAITTFADRALALRPEPAAAAAESRPAPPP
jgi:pimeloyl-ACP methyl ester carboxylesterase